MLRNTRSGDAEIADLSNLLPLLQQRHQTVDSIQVMHLQQIDSLRFQTLERAMKTCLTAVATAEEPTRRELGREKHPIADAQHRERIADQRLAVAIGRCGVDARAAEPVY